MNKRKITIIVVSTLFIFLVTVVIILLICCECLHENFDSLENDFVVNSNNIDPSTIHIFMSFDEKYAKLIGNNCAKINKLYADKYGFQFHKFILPKHKGYAPHYNRYFDLLTLMNKYPQEENYFIYVDGDAIILENKLDIRHWIPQNPNTHIIFSNENNYDIFIKIHSTFRNLLYGISFNSGVFIVKNTKWSKQFVQSILNNSKCSHDKKELGSYDQTCISKIYRLNQNNEHEHIRVFPMKKAIQHYYQNNKDRNIPILHTISGNLNKPTYLQTMEPTLKPYIH